MRATRPLITGGLLLFALACDSESCQRGSNQCFSVETCERYSHCAVVEKCRQVQCWMNGSEAACAQESNCRWDVERGSCLRVADVDCDVGESECKTRSGCEWGPRCTITKEVDCWDIGSEDECRNVGYCSWKPSPVN